MYKNRLTYRKYYLLIFLCAVEDNLKVEAVFLMDPYKMQNKTRTLFCASALRQRLNFRQYVKVKVRLGLQLKFVFTMLLCNFFPPT